MKGLEPPRLSAPDPKSGAATNYATSACYNLYMQLQIRAQIYELFHQPTFILMSLISFILLKILFVYFCLEIANNTLNLLADG